MENSKINFGTVILNSLKVLIIVPLTLPLKIYTNTLKALSNIDNKDSVESTLSSDFPLYVWLISLFNAVIALIYPIGLIIALYNTYEYSENSYVDGSELFMSFFAMIAGTYFTPLYAGLIKELLSVALKNLFYLKTISNK
tara:strand:- start:608 stop:1027 length:420 start_codon:yes stop_codon:yes gene_type:complete